MEFKKIQKKPQKIWIITKKFYTFAENNTTMTNKEWKIKNLRQSWGELLLKKESLLKDIWTTEYKLNQIKEELLRYGVHHEISELGKDKADMGESNYLDNCFACDNNTDVHEL